MWPHGWPLGGVTVFFLAALASRRGIREDFKITISSLL